MPTHFSRTGAAGAVLLLAAACGRDTRVARAGDVDTGDTVALQRIAPQLTSLEEYLHAHSWGRRPQPTAR